MNTIRKFFFPTYGDTRLKKKEVNFFGYRPNLVLWEIERFSECGNWKTFSFWKSKEEALKNSKR